MNHALWTACLGLTAIGCASPTPNDLVRIDLPGLHRYALSTEDGLVALDHGDLVAEEVPIAYPWEESLVVDDATIAARTGDLALLLPKTARLPRSDFAAEPARGDEELFVQIVEKPRQAWRPDLVPARLYRNGEFGDLLELGGDLSPEWLAAEFPGSGVYALRKGRYVIVGLLAGTLATSPGAEAEAPPLLPFLGLDAIAPVLPTDSDFFARRLRPFRPDFEYGLTRDGFEPAEGSSK